MTFLGDLVVGVDGIFFIVLFVNGERFCEPFLKARFIFLPFFFLFRCKSQNDL